MAVTPLRLWLFYSFVLELDLQKFLLSNLSCCCLSFARLPPLRFWSFCLWGCSLSRINDKICVFASISEFKLGELPDKTLAKGLQLEVPLTSLPLTRVWLMSRRAGTASTVRKKRARSVGMHCIAFLPVSQQPLEEWCTFWFKASEQFCKHWLGGLFNLW